MGLSPRCSHTHTAEKMATPLGVKRTRQGQDVSIGHDASSPDRRRQKGHGTRPSIICNSTAIVESEGTNSRDPGPEAVLAEHRATGFRPGSRTQNKTPPRSCRREEANQSKSQKSPCNDHSNARTRVSWSAHVSALATPQATQVKASQRGRNSLLLAEPGSSPKPKAHPHRSA